MSCCKQVNKTTVIDKFLRTYNDVPEMKRFSSVLKQYNGTNTDEILNLLCLERWYIYNDYDFSKSSVRSYIGECDDMIRCIEC